jgi:hypothetical protein
MNDLYPQTASEAFDAIKSLNANTAAILKAATQFSDAAYEIHQSLIVLNRMGGAVGASAKKLLTNLNRIEEHRRMMEIGGLTIAAEKLEQAALRELNG